MADIYADHKKKIAERNKARQEGTDGNLPIEEAVPTLDNPEEQALLEQQRLTPEEGEKRRHAFMLEALKHKGKHKLGKLDPETIGQPALMEGRTLATFCIICHAPLGSCGHFKPGEE